MRGKGTYAYKPEDCEKVKIYARIGAPLTYIAKLVGCNKLTVLQNKDLRAAYDEAKEEFSLKLYKTFSFKALETQDFNCLKLAMDYHGLRMENNPGIDFSDCKNYQDSCNLINEYFANHEISVEQYKTLNDTIAQQYQIAHLIDDVEALKRYFAENNIGIDFKNEKKSS